MQPWLSLNQLPVRDEPAERRLKMVSIAGMFQHYRQAFDDHQARVLAEATVQIEADLVRREDFSELTATVGRLAGAQA
jgi:hypothetical protein